MRRHARRSWALLGVTAWLAGCNAILGIEDPKHRLVEDACGDGERDDDEPCDDGNLRDGDGCDAVCEVERGFACEGAPSVCATVCGDGLIAGDETCDDGAAIADDGCDELCAPELGFSCQGEPSVCARVCGDGVIAPGEQCDDGALIAGDGCDAACQVEHGFLCSGEPSGCVSTCGDGLVATDEPCDDGNTTVDDGCDAACQIEHGFTCDAIEPSGCTSQCSDGLVATDEECDDHNADPGDGCDATCTIEHGYVCGGEPSACSSQCGDGAIGPGEVCDDGNVAPGDGCSAACVIESGFTCTAGEPSVCSPICGDSIVIAGKEPCDDGNNQPNDGCNPACQIEPGWGCSGQPSFCGGICGDGSIVGAEQCDDGNLISGDCCSSACTKEAGCEVEPNNSTAQADARAADPMPVQLTNSGLIKGAVNPIADLDYFAYDLGVASTVVRFETFDATATDCGAINTKLTLHNNSGILMTSDLDAGINLCSALVLPLTAGSYYVRVEQTGGAVIPAYALQVSVLSNGFSESESNDTIGTADNLAGTNVYIAGSHQVAADTDFFTITIPGPTKKSVRAEIVEGSAAETCESGGIASRLTLYNSASMQIADDDAGGGRGLCSLLDGTGAAPLTAGAHLLDPGVYYLRVKAASAAAGQAAQFDYRLAVTIR